MNKKIVCIVCDGYWEQHQGGAEYQYYLLANSLADQGYPVHYVYVDRGTPVCLGRIRLSPLHLSAKLRAVFYPYQMLLHNQVFNALDEIRPDVIINRVGNALTGICARYSVKRGIPFIWHIANVTDLLPLRFQLNRTMLLAYLDKKFLDYGIRHATGIIAQARYQDRMLRMKFGRKAIAIVPNFHPIPASCVAKEAPLLVAWVANIKPKKRPEAYIRLASLFADDPSLRFVMVGRANEGRYQQRIDDLLCETPNVQFLGELPIEEVNQLLSRASIFVNTSEFEGFPNTFIQAWMRSVPVVSLSFDPDDVISKNELGFVSGDTTRLCEDVRALIHNPAMREAMGERARQYATAVHSVNDNVARIIEIFEDVKP